MRSPGGWESDAPAFTAKPHHSLLLGFQHFMEEQGNLQHGKRYVTTSLSMLARQAGKQTGNGPHPSIPFCLQSLTKRG